mmetsp:Transcript_20570/g.14806  ORF Transcript_20570/g.14806 Transcript_20570/m.14806 type:complete len:105 (-) Transcript_20570:548-862(-)
MIQSAHVGVGIYGKEGNSAAQFSDYAVPKFKHLRRLMFWHGRNFGHNLSQFIYWNIFKNTIRTSVLFWHQLSNGYSGNIFYEGIFIWSYNVVCTNLALGFFVLD